LRLGPAGLGLVTPGLMAAGLVAAGLVAAGLVAPCRVRRAPARQRRGSESSRRQARRFQPAPPKRPCAIPVGRRSRSTTAELRSTSAALAACSTGCNVKPSQCATADACGPNASKRPRSPKRTTSSTGNVIEVERISTTEYCYAGSITCFCTTTTGRSAEKPMGGSG
ncbi:MAG: hypothetical protein KF801_09835, partial [Cryobacterium sp.]|nr:hypothetical protein [Cryobacterium sp.]